jgi:glycosyltransferase involved in cell wall biosynthesis
MNKTAIIIPAWNEEKYIEQTLKDIQKLNMALDIIVISDGSTDKTVSIAKKYATTVIDNKTNNGKGYVTRQACDKAAKTYESIILFDADGQHRAQDIPRFLNELKRKPLVLGYRSGKGMPARFKIGNWGLSVAAWFFSGKKVKDTQSGFRAFTSKLYKQIRWQANDYFMETEMILRLKTKQISQIEIPVIYHDHAKGTSVGTGIKIFFTMIAFVFKRILN